jgi:hypothetical protein
VNTTLFFLCSRTLLVTVSRYTFIACLVLSLRHLDRLWAPLVRYPLGRGQLKCDGTRAENRFRLSAKRTSPFKSARGASVQSTTGSRGVRISGSNAGYTMFRGSLKSTGYPLHSSVSPSFSLPCVTACRHISTGLYKRQSTCWRQLQAFRDRQSLIYWQLRFWETAGYREL